MAKPVLNKSGLSDNLVQNAMLATTKSKLPYYVELRTGSLKTFISEQIPEFGDKDKIQKWLSISQFTGFYFELTKNIHLEFLGQPDGRGTEYWWRLFFNDFSKKLIIEQIKIQPYWSKAKNDKNNELTWNGLNFRSQTEIRIARALLTKNILFFTNATGFMNLTGLPLSNIDDRNKEKVEVDFLVFYNQKCMILEVDGKHHLEASQQKIDYKRNRVFLREGIATVRFSAEQCWENTTAVVEEFLELFNASV